METYVPVQETHERQQLTAVCISFTTSHFTGMQLTTDVHLEVKSTWICTSTVTCPYGMACTVTAFVTCTRQKPSIQVLGYLFQIPPPGPPLLQVPK